MTSTTSAARRRRLIAGVFVLGLMLAALLPPVVSGSERPFQARRVVSDIRDLLLTAAQKTDPEFPDGRNAVLTRFAYIGKVTSSQGVIYIIELKQVLTNMPAPRGYSCIAAFDHRFRFLGRIPFLSSHPLWCEDGRIYLFGDLDIPSEYGSGNVIDLSRGFANCRIFHQKRYGSSGGTLED